MVTKKGTPQTSEKKDTKTVTKSTPIKILKRDTPIKEQGLQILARFYLGEVDLEMIKRRGMRYENRQLSDSEAVLALLAELIRNADDPQLKAKQMESVAEFQSMCGMDPRPVLAEMHKLELRIFKELGFEAVSMECKKDACPACKKINGVKLTIEEALELMPLPHSVCTKRTHAKASPFCRCRYFGEYVG